MIISRLVIAHRPFLNTLLRHFQTDMYFAVALPVRGHDSKLHGIQRMSGIASRNVRKKGKGILLDHRIVCAHPLFLIIDRPLNQSPNVLLGKRLQLKDNGA